mgnify:CR=1 FL=1
MKLNIVVLAKQVPDTRNVGKDAMTAEGTVNRAALPAIFNPEDLNALEQALRLKDLDPENVHVGVVTMGPPRAGEILRESLYRGADEGWLLTDRKSAGADTLATAYFLSKAIEKIDKDVFHVDLVIGGRQAIDGDTAQVGPQVAQKLGLNQVTYAEEIKEVKDGKATIVRHIDGDRKRNSRASTSMQRQARDEIQIRLLPDGAQGRRALGLTLRDTPLPHARPVEHRRLRRRLRPVWLGRLAHEGESREEHRLPGEGEQEAHRFRRGRGGTRKRTVRREHNWISS